jgi:hypothetical protein
MAKATDTLHEDLPAYIILPRHLRREYNKSFANIARKQIP